jgi:hypothetical protein
VSRAWESTVPCPACGSKQWATGTLRWCATCGRETPIRYTKLLPLDGEPLPWDSGTRLLLILCGLATAVGVAVAFIWPAEICDWALRVFGP